MRLSAAEKEEIIRLVDGSELGGEPNLAAVGHTQEYVLQVVQVVSGKGAHRAAAQSQELTAVELNPGRTKAVSGRNSPGAHDALPQGVGGKDHR